MNSGVLTTTKWNVDKNHSAIEFEVKHLMITSVKGEFRDYELMVETEGEDFTTSKFTFTADIASVTSGSEDRDTHLKSPDFFDAVKFPKLIFVATGVEKLNETNYILHGNLTIRDVTKPVALNVERGGIAKDPWGGTRAGFTVTGRVNRKDFGLKWNVITEAGGMLVGEEVKINCTIQLVKA